MDDVELACTLTRGGFSLALELRLRARWTVLFGPSGAGKSSLLRLVAGLERPDAGRIAVDGRVMAGPGVWVAPAERGIGWVSQRPRLFPHMNVAENVAFAGMDGDAVLARLGLEPLRKRMPAGLSGGETQAVALARALVRRPQLLLLDEPFSGMDAERRAAMLAELGSCRVMMASHEVADGFVFGAEVVRMEQGRVTAAGPAEQVLASERTALLARLRPHHV